MAPMTNEETLDIFRQTKALLEGHFILRSGLHSRQYFQCALALQEMPIVEKLAAALVEKLRHLDVRTVISPAMVGLVIGQAYDGTARPFAWALLICSTLALCFVLYSEKGVLFRRLNVKPPKERIIP